VGSNSSRPHLGSLFGRPTFVTVTISPLQAPNVVLGMFLVNANNAVVLFDSRTSHSFIFIAYAEKHNLLISMLKNRMIVSSNGGEMPVT
jgi:hypothetical protein